jgi:secreted trypsin-like serine protease
MPSHRTHRRRRLRGPLPALVLISVLLPSLPGTSIHAICHGSPVGYDFAAALYDANLQCGGTVLPGGGGWILTAAHCGNVLAVGLRGRPGRFKTAECYSHPQFNVLTLENDVAMIRLASPPAGLQGLRPVDAGWKETTLQPLIIAGWSGCSDDLSQALRSASVLTVPVDACRTFYKLQMSSYIINPAENLCTDVVNSRVFNGDSGGPVIAKVNGQDRLAGVISVGVGPPTGPMKLPDRHTRVTDYLTWIQQVQAGVQQARSRRCGT